MSRIATPADAPTLLSIWQSALPRLIIDYGAGNVNQVRTAQDFIDDMARDAEYWLLNNQQGYWAARPASIPTSVTDGAVGVMGWWGFEAPMIAGLSQQQFRQAMVEVARDWRDRGIALGYRWGWTTGPLTLPAVAIMDATCQRRHVLGADGLWVFDLTSMVVA